MVKLFRFFLLVIFGSHLDPAMEPFYCLYVLLATLFFPNHPKKGQVHPNYQLFHWKRKKKLIFRLCFLDYLGPKTHFKHRFFFPNFFKFFKFQTPLAAKLCESSPQFFLIMTQCIPYYQSGMVSMSRGRVDDDDDDDDDDENWISNRI